METAEQGTQETYTETDGIDTIVTTAKEQFETEMEKLRPAHEAFLRLQAIVGNFERVTNAQPRRGRRTGGASRPDEFLRFVTEAGEEGIAVSDAAERMDVKPNYLYRIAKDLVEAGTIAKGEDKRYRTA